jgi:hypothetical protein
LKGKPDIIATVQLYSTDAGGRSGPTPSDIYGCPLEFEGEKFDCRLLLRDVGALLPGTSGRVPVAFLYPESIKPRLKVGSRFTLWELRTIAEGVVEEVLAD